MAATKRTSATKKTPATKRAPATKKTEAEDVIARLADKGEDSLRWLVGIPHRTLGEEPGAVVTLKPGAHATEDELRAMDPLDGRVAALERRLGALEKPARKTTRTSATRAKAPATRRAATTAAAEAERDRGPGDDSMASNAERNDAPAGGGIEQTR
jgi:acyl-CoA synthetase (AMP-forming)/AMP-acid ligase II